jgi:hypothetical protein
MDFGPRFDKTLLGLRQPAPDALDGIKGKHGLGFLIHRMKVRPVMGRTYFHEHSNDDSEEARDLWHVVNSTSSKLGPVWLTIALQPRRFVIVASADGCKRLLCPLKLIA